MAISPSLDLSQTSLFHTSQSPMAEIVRRCTRVAATNASILITGETGTGKEVLARHVHDHSPRRGRNFVAVNCGAIPEALMESELFGHVKGAFTGAALTRKGRVALAEGGTLFLDEIGELPLSMQVKLLRLLQQHTYEPVGSPDSVRVDFRLIAATNRDLAAEVAAGRFRSDLYYRLIVFPVHLPPLRERRCDIAGLAQQFWARLDETRPLLPSLFEAMADYPWPGNVRELENLVERLSVSAEGEEVGAAELPWDIRLPGRLSEETSAEVRRALAPPPAPPVKLVRTLQPTVPSPQELGGAPVDLPRVLRELEERYIDTALEAAHGNRKAAADLLGLQRTTLVEKLKRREARPTVSATSLTAPVPPRQEPDVGMPLSRAG